MEFSFSHFQSIVEKAPLFTSEDSSFAHHTMKNRLPKILDQIIHDNEFGDEDVVESLIDLKESLKNNGWIERFKDHENAGDLYYQVWSQEYDEKLRDRRWLEVEWFVCESYFYRLVLSKIGYFEEENKEEDQIEKEETKGGGSSSDHSSNISQNDPFYKSKLRSLVEDEDTIQFISSISSLLFSNNEEEDDQRNIRDRLKLFFMFSLWGNRVDGCYKEVMNQKNNQEYGGNKTEEAEDDMLLIDEREKFIEVLIDKIDHLHSSSTSSNNNSIFQDEKELNSTQSLKEEEEEEEFIILSFVTDNCGNEILCDICLMICLLQFFPQHLKIRIHCKKCPTFVSDITTSNFDVFFLNLQTSPVASLLPQLIDRFYELVKVEEKIQICGHDFWNGPLFFDQIPLNRNISNDNNMVVGSEIGDVMLIKGDANYRRVVFDTRWDCSSIHSLQDIISTHYNPSSSILSHTPFICLRTLKSDPIVGLNQDQVDKLDEVDHNWRINGKRGIIQVSILFFKFLMVSLIGSQFRIKLLKMEPKYRNT